jgi:hypothetical protein
LKLTFAVTIFDYKNVAQMFHKKQPKYKELKNRFKSHINRVNWSCWFRYKKCLECKEPSWRALLEKQKTYFLSFFKLIKRKRHLKLQSRNMTFWALALICVCSSKWSAIEKYCNTSFQFNVAFLISLLCKANKSLFLSIMN